jgi:hypothetical protein
VFRPSNPLSTIRTPPSGTLALEFRFFLGSQAHLAGQWLAGTPGVFWRTRLRTRGTAITAIRVALSIFFMFFLRVNPSATIFTIWHLFSTLSPRFSSSPLRGHESLGRKILSVGIWLSSLRYDISIVSLLFSSFAFLFEFLHPRLE